VGIPFSLYSTFVVEDRHGFNKMTPGLFFSDFAKSSVLEVVIGMPLLWALIYIVKWGGPSFHYYLFGFTVSFGLLFSLIYPNLIAPLFNKFEPLHDVELRQKIEKLAADLKFPLTELYQMDGSKRSAHSNAYFYGFWWAKRIVLYDTLLTMSHDEILAVLGHELGHWKLNHTIKGLTISIAHLFVVFWLFNLVLYSPMSAALFASFGFKGESAVYLALSLFESIYTPVAHVIHLAMTMLTRKNEFEADAFAVSLGKGTYLKSALMGLHKENKGDCNPDPWYSWYHHSHPPLVERLRAIDAEIARGEAKRK